MPRTLAEPVSCSGVALHSGSPASVTLRPAPAGTGIRFHRIDTGKEVPAAHDRVGATVLATVLCAEGSTAPVVGTVEHLMAALAACRVSDLVVTVDGPEMPILDGSAAAWMLLLDCAGFADSPGPAAAIRVLRPVQVAQNEAWARLDPDPDATSLAVTLEIEFPNGRLPQQRAETDDSETAFRDILAVARTFTFTDEIAVMRQAGLARGGSLANAVVIGTDGPLNPEGYRGPDECVRHKALDAVGDLALAGAPILGRFSGHRSGHKLNNLLLRALFADPANWRTEPLDRAG